MEYRISENQSIQQIIDQVPKGPITILLKTGVFFESLCIHRDDITLMGEGMDQTIIRFNQSVKDPKTGHERQNTFQTSTVVVFGNHVKLENLTIENMSGSGKTFGQAVALSLYGNQTILKHVRLKSFQDTLFLGPLPEDLVTRYQGFLDDRMLHKHHAQHYLKNCEIFGSVDYIFGCGEAYILKSKIVSIEPGYILAPSTKEEDIGFVLDQCHIINQSQGLIYLGRPWRNHGFSFFNDCMFEGSFHPDRYHDWDKSSYRFYESPEQTSTLLKPMDIKFKNQIHLKIKEAYQKFK